MTEFMWLAYFPFDLKHDYSPFDIIDIETLIGWYPTIRKECFDLFFYHFQGGIYHWENGNLLGFFCKVCCHSFFFFVFFNF
jgi:hypothetical protein